METTSGSSALPSKKAGQQAQESARSEQQGRENRRPIDRVIERLLQAAGPSRYSACVIEKPRRAIGKRQRRDNWKRRVRHAATFDGSCCRCHQQRRQQNGCPLGLKAKVALKVRIESFEPTEERPCDRQRREMLLKTPIAKVRAPVRTGRGFCGYFTNSLALLMKVFLTPKIRRHQCPDTHWSRTAAVRKSADPSQYS